ncbi:hypothetical protein Cni_G19166 [Canna indica]|uniref:Peptidase M50 domain-containing protein n=1 Tax=Canna indica TaxID=4628 RepID=A0AAQ3QIA3_9LILI|nr:hypothetical protein Cni_G19166 [Canna indica]
MVEGIKCLDTVKGDMSVSRGDARVARALLCSSPPSRRVSPRPAGERGAHHRSLRSTFHHLPRGWPLPRCHPSGYLRLRVRHRLRPRRPVLAHFVVGGVNYSLRFFLLYGGFVAFPDFCGCVDDANLLRNRPVLDRLIVDSAGVAATVVLSYLNVFSKVLIIGHRVKEPLPGLLASEVRPGSAAAGGDVVLEIDDDPAPSATEAEYAIGKINGRNAIKMKVLREGDEFLELAVVADGTGTTDLHISPNFRNSIVPEKNLAEVATFASREFLEISSKMLDEWKQMYSKFPKSLGHLVGPFHEISAGAEFARSRPGGIYLFVATHNLELVIFNLLPIPGLDGGHLALALVEAAMGGRRISGQVGLWITIVVLLRPCSAKKTPPRLKEL